MRDTQNLPTGIPHIQAHITRKYDAKTNQIRLRGYAYDSRTGAQCDGCICHRRSASPEKEPMLIHQLVNQIAEEYRCVSQPVQLSAKTGAQGIFSSAFSSLTSLDEVCSPDWADSTRHSTLQYLQRNVLPKLDQYGCSITEEDMHKIEAELTTAALNSSRSNSNEQTARQSVSSYLYRVDFILRRLSFLCPELPSVQFRMEAVHIPQLEQAKSLPDVIRIRLAALLLHLIPNGLTMGVILMFLLGLRPSEACAVEIGTLTLESDYLVCPVLVQMQGKKKVDRLKTDAAYRSAVGPYLAVFFARKRLDYLQSLGYSQEQLQVMPLVSSPKSPVTSASGSELSAYVRQLLSACGCSKEFWHSAAILMVKEPDISPESMAEKSVEAYVLRRDFITRALNCCGMSAVDVDYLVGHANRAPHMKDYTSPEIQQVLAAQLERYVFSPTHTRNPLFRAVPAVPGTICLQSFPAYRLCNQSNEPVLVDINLETLDGGGTILVRTTGQMKCAEYRDRCSIDDPELRAERPIMLLPHPENYYLQQIEIANTIDCSPFLPADSV